MGLSQTTNRRGPSRDRAGEKEELVFTLHTEALTSPKNAWNACTAVIVT